MTKSGIPAFKLELLMRGFELREVKGQTRIYVKVAVASDFITMIELRHEFPFLTTFVEDFTCEKFFTTIDHRRLRRNPPS